jgi:hypothetical protein
MRWYRGPSHDPSELAEIEHLAQFINTEDRREAVLLFVSILRG